MERSGTGGSCAMGMTNRQEVTKEVLWRPKRRELHTDEARASIRSTGSRTEARAPVCPRGEVWWKP